MADDQLRIRLLAYRIWEAEDCPDGQADRHWHMACRMVAAERITDVPQDAQPRTAARSTRASEPVAAETTSTDADASVEPVAKKAPARRANTAKRRSTASSAEKKATASKAAAEKTTTRKTPAVKKKSAATTATTTRRSNSSNDDKPSQ